MTENAEYENRFKAAAAKAKREATGQEAHQNFLQMLLEIDQVAEYRETSSGTEERLRLQFPLLGDEFSRYQIKHAKSWLSVPVRLGGAYHNPSS